MRYLAIGALGFIGYNWVSEFKKNHPNDELLIVDKQTYAANNLHANPTLDIGLEDFDGLDNISKRPLFMYRDIVDIGVPSTSPVWKEVFNGKGNKWLTFLESVDYIINFAAESHVDNSLKNSDPFFHTNSNGVLKLADAIKNNCKNLKKFIHFSTDEVYGSIIAGSADETYALKPGNPYSASKASADMVLSAYHNTYGIPVVIIRPSNNFGPYQNKEKFIPSICNAIKTKSDITLYGEGKQCRQWLYVKDTVNAVELLLKDGVCGEIYNVGGHNLLSNRELIDAILFIHGDKCNIRKVPDRLGHDFMYSIDDTKIASLGMKYSSFQDSLKETIKWYVDTQQ